ncbi:MAG: hydrogenase expression protein [Synergistaceae bacterium]|jgi:hydrogenase maturation factor|nr:hydrogenase expression protein [Synergistaceae bacterium]
MSEYHTVGKLPPDILESDVLSLHGAPRFEVLIGPGPGEDAALIRWTGEPYLVAASDPIVGADEGAGRLLVHVNANDIACKGGDPAWFVVTLIVPARDGSEGVRRIMEEIHSTCEALGIAVVGGHTELTDRYDRAVVVGTMMGPSRYNLRAENIRAGDVILMTRHTGLEGMSIVAHDRPDLLSFLTGEELAEVRSWQNDLSVLKEARLLRDLARYMHDPTEGGLAGGLLEARKACGLGIALDAGNIPISPLTAKAAETLGFDPLHLISSGVLVAVLDRSEAGEALSRLSREGIRASVIGRFVEPAAERESDAHEELWGLLDRPAR